MPVKTVYVPRYPELYALLFNTYAHAMEKGADQVWVERVKAIGLTLEAAKKDGFVSIEFTKRFSHDVTDIMREVHDKIELKDLNDSQSSLTFLMANLQSSFGHRG